MGIVPLVSRTNHSRRHRYGLVGMTALLVLAAIASVLRVSYRPFRGC